MIVRNLNDLTQNAPKTYLSNPEAAGTTIFRLRNSAGIGSQWAIQLGETGESTSEVLLVSGTPSGTIGTSTTVSLFAHPSDTPVYGIKWNQVVFEVSTVGTTGTATPLTNGTVGITPNNWDATTGRSYTIFDDVTGSASYAYKTYLRNSAIPLTSTESDWIVITPKFYTLAYIRSRIKDKLWNPTFVTDNVVDNWINEWKDEMTNAVIAVNEDYSIGTVNVSFGTAGLGTVTTADFKQPKRIEVTYNGADYFLSTKRGLNEYYPAEVVNAAHPYHNWQGDNVIHVMPSDQAGTAKIWYYQLGTPMVNDMDELPNSMKGYTKSFVDYGLSQAYQKDGKSQEANLNMQSANAQKQLFVMQSAPRDKTGPTFVSIQEVTSGEDNLVW